MSIHLVIGASGLVGDHLVKALTQFEEKVVGTYHTHDIPGLERLDIRNFIDVKTFITKKKPNVIYLPACIPNVDYCETYPEETYITNVLGTYNVANVANLIKAKLVFFSSDYIFDGKQGPYDEAALPNPICEYGKQKLIAEHYLSIFSFDYLIIRTNGVYGEERQGKNFIYRLIKTIKGKKVLKVPIDQFGTPTYAPNLAKAVGELIYNNAKGIYNIAGPKLINRYEYAVEAAKTFDLDDTLIKPITTYNLNQTARRPLKGGLVVEKAAAQLRIPLMDYTEGLQEMAVSLVDNDNLLV